MKLLMKNKARYFVPKRTFLIVILLLSAVGIMGFGLMGKKVPAKPNYVIKKDSVGSVMAFRQVYKVLESPRCMNCHPSGDVPLQGDDSHLHTMFPRRGVDGTGVYAMKCSNCHQATNTLGMHTPPGNPKWKLPPADMRMVFQGRTPHQLAKQLTDPKQNGNRGMEQLIAHASDTLVKWAWHPGEGRTLPPLTYQQFKKAWITWITKGAYAPAGK
ncbi:MAG TPA: hypothetical protein VHC47_04765 [Mucilaginibacter sp.]|nr:hypothetical protein [Mucilaginibacter sp.]